jgi:hypothetical protein
MTRTVSNAQLGLCRSLGCSKAVTQKLFSERKALAAVFLKINRLLRGFDYDERRDYSIESAISSMVDSNLSFYNAFDERFGPLNIKWGIQLNTVMTNFCRRTEG